MNGKQPKTQLQLPLFDESRGEAPAKVKEGTEPFRMERATESPATTTETLMEEICNPTSLREALQRVKANKGSPGVDGMTVQELPGYLKEHWPSLREELLSGTYTPQPVRRVEIEKPDGGVRKLGIPTALDRFIQQAALQVLQRYFDPTFSPHSYGFRPGRSAHQAVAQAQQYLAEGYTYVVDMDLEKFFDRVNHDILMSRVARRIADKRVLRLIRAYLNAGVMEGGLVSPTEEGTPQGGPLSPLLSNIVLDDLDKELERRGHRFARYADDCNIYVRSERAGQRVMENITRFLSRKLKLTVNQEKSAIGRPWERKFLGFSFTNDAKLRRRIAPKAMERFKNKVRKMTRRTCGRKLERIIEELAPYLRGWAGYFKHTELPSDLQVLDKWIRRRLRCIVWMQWKRGKQRYKELVKRGVSSDWARTHAGSSKGVWHLSRSKPLHQALPNSFFESLGLPSLVACRQA